MVNETMIPAEAVEAAAKAMALKSYNKEFDAMDDHTQNFLRDNARLALEAAAPYIRDQGYLDGLRATRDSLLAFADDRDTALGAIRSHITTYELRTLLGAEE